MCSYGNTVATATVAAICRYIQFYVMDCTQSKRIKMTMNTNKQYVHVDAQAVLFSDCVVRPP